ncbi:MAG: ATP-binding cassette domain-containing protein [Bryobacteraceae bacterium]
MQAAIRTEHLTRRFGKFVAVNQVSFQLQQGLNLGLLGPNGAGKSTLIRLLTTLLTPTGGRAEVWGHDVVKQAAKVRRAIGVVAQAATSDLDLTAAENLYFFGGLYSLPYRGRGAVVEALLSSVDLLQWRDKKVGTFSGGMRRRLEVARSLVHRPQVLFLDEPTTGLDPASRLAMWDMLRRVKAEWQLTVLLTTHYMEEADKLCDIVAVFDHGGIVAMGPPEQLKAAMPGTRKITLSITNSPPDLRSALGGLSGVTGLETRDGAWQLESADSQATAEAVFGLARERGLTINSLAIEQRTLEDVFIHYTGRGLRDSVDNQQRDKVVYLYQRGPRQP